MTMLIAFQQAEPGRLGVHEPLSSSSAVAIMGPCCWARVMLLVSAFTTPRRRMCNL